MRNYALKYIKMKQPKICNLGIDIYRRANKTLCLSNVQACQTENASVVDR